MSMGAGSSGVTPIRRSSTPRRRNATTNENSPETVQENNSLEREQPDESLPTYVGVGGGLSNRRIVAKLPQEINGNMPYNANLITIVKYVTSPDVASSDVDKMVVDDISSRIKDPDCRLLINNPPGLGTPYNLGREHLQDSLKEYLIPKEQRTGNGDVKINFCDIAIVTHDEGGMYKGLEKICK